MSDLLQCCECLACCAVCFWCCCGDKHKSSNVATRTTTVIPAQPIYVQQQPPNYGFGQPASVVVASQPMYSTGGGIQSTTYAQPTNMYNPNNQMSSSTYTTESRGNYPGPGNIGSTSYVTSSY